MDIPGEIVAAVIWFFAGSIGAAIIGFGVYGIFLLISAKTDNAALVFIGVPVAWVLAMLWEAFVAVQVILHIYNILAMIFGWGEFASA